MLSEITLERQALGFGFRIVGGTEEGSQVTVGHIVPQGAADNNPRIETGDEILSIDGHNVVSFEFTQSGCVFISINSMAILYLIGAIFTSSCCSVNGRGSSTWSRNNDFTTSHPRPKHDECAAYDASAARARPHFPIRCNSQPKRERKLWLCHNIRIKSILWLNNW